MSSSGTVNKYNISFFRSTATLIYFLLAAFVMLFAVSALFISPTLTQAQTFNQEINYQGKLADNLGATVADGSYSMVFRLYTVATAGTHVWTETQDVTVTNGLFSVMLGSDTSLSGVDFNRTLYLGVNIETDGEMTPRKILGAVPAAFEANNSQTLGGVASTSFLRNDIPNAASALLSFTGGFVSSASSTISELTTGTTTVTTLMIDGQEFTSLSGGASGLTNNAGTLTANISEANLNITGTPTNNYILQASSTAAGGFVWAATSTLGFEAAGVDNSTDVTLAGENYLTINGSQQITAAAIDLSGTNVTGTLAAARFPALTGDITTSAGSLTTNIAAGVINFGDINYTNTLASNPALATGQTYFGSTGLLFEGSTADNFEGLLTTANITGSDKTWTLPNTTGTIALTSSAMTGTFDGNNFAGGAVSAGDLLYGSGNGVIAERSIGSTGQVLQVVGGLPVWVATSTLGIGGGATAFLGLSDTPGSFTANRLFFANSGGTALTDSADLVFDGTNFGIGTNTPTERLTVAGNINLTSGSAYKYNGADVIIASTTLNNYFFGGAGNLTMTGSNNTANGRDALFSNTTGSFNTASGFQALLFNTTGNNNTANGFLALSSNTTGSNNTANGYLALLSNTTGNNNTASGFQALFSNTTGNGNTANGVQAGFDINTAAGTGANTLIGYNTGRGIVTGVNNTILGANVTGLSSTLSNNIIIADGAGNQRINVDGSGNVGIGSTTPTSRLTVAGDAYITGALRDSTNSAGLNGMILQTTGAGTQWVATSTLGFRSGLWTASGLNAYFNTGNIGIGTTTSSNRLTVFDTVADAQFSLAYDASRFANFQVDSAGTLILSPTGNDVQIYNSNLSVCEGVACPSITASSTAGYGIFENGIYFGNGFKIDQTSSSSAELGVYDDAGAIIMIFD